MKTYRSLLPEDRRLMNLQPIRTYDALCDLLITVS